VFCVGGIGASLMRGVRRHMRRIAGIGTVAALLLCACSSWAQDATGPQVCSAAVREALLTALRFSVADVPVDYAPERIDGRLPAIPDYNILPRVGPILVRVYLDEPKCVLDTSVLPRSARRSFVLVDDEDLGRRAGERENGVTYVSANRVRLGNDEVVVWLSAALRLPPGDTRGRTCCCGGEMVLRRINGKWQFIEWRDIVCA
jgi:hypothetical protein